MAVHACFMAILVAAAATGASETPPRTEEDLLISANHVLADVNQLYVVLATQETPAVERMIDVLGLKAQIGQKLRDAGITPLERETETTHRLVVHIEGIEVPGSDKYVYRVQTALCRLVTIPGLENRRLQTEVWRVRPVMEAVVGSEAGRAISSAVLVQAAAFVGAHQAASSVLKLTEDAGGAAPQAGAEGRMQTAPQNLQAVAADSFIASKSSDVFHRSDCRWAQNIAGNNLIVYKTRQEAAQSGKRPCKSCKP